MSIAGRKALLGIIGLCAACDAAFDMAEDPAVAELEVDGVEPLGLGDSLRPRPKFKEVWSSAGQTLNGVSVAAVGFLDGDDKIDFVTETFNETSLLVYEHDGHKGFDPVSIVPAPGEPAFVALAIGDADQDGAAEFLAGVTVQNRLRLFEATGDDTYAERDIDIAEPALSTSLRRVVVADTDEDGRREIILGIGLASSSGDSSDVYIYEHDGVPGSDTYTKVFTYTTVSSLFDLTVGDSDNDGRQEIVLSFSAGLGFPIRVRRLENTGDNTYEHKMQALSELGVGSVPIVADLDLDGDNEIVYAGVVTDGNGLVVVEATADDTYEVAYSDFGLSGSGVALSVGAILDSPYPAIAVGSSRDADDRGQLQLWRYTGHAYEPLLDRPMEGPGTAGSIHIGNLDGDGRPDLLIVRGNPGNEIQWLEQQH